MRTLCYVSQANFDLPTQMQHLSDILTEARQFNLRQHIYGVLYFADGTFLQCLEAKSEDLDQVMQRICRDPRHREIKIVFDHPISHAQFSNWSMKFIARHHPIKQFFQKHGFSHFCPEQLSAQQWQDLLHLLYELEADDLVA